MIGTIQQGTTLNALLARTTAARPDSAAVVQDGELTDWATLSSLVEGMAACLAGRGIGRSDRVALRLANSRDYLTAILAIARLGAMAVHVNTRFGPAEIADLVHRTDARLLLTDGPLRGAPAVDVVEVPLPSGGTCADLSVPEDDCLVYTTGGTTARPKLVVHRQGSIAVHAARVAQVAGFEAADAVYLAAAPLCGTFGNVGAMAALAGGATMVTMRSFDADEAARLIAEHRITHLLGDDRMVDRLAAAGTYSSVRFCGAAAFGADARPALARGVEAGLRPRAIYGSSEVQALFALGDEGGGGWGAVTPVHSSAEVAVVEDELRLAAPSLFDRYLDDPADTEAALRDGLFRTGDRAAVKDGGFVFEGRMGDVLRLGGFLVSPLEIEAFLTRQPGVAEAQVVGVPRERGTAAFAFAIPRPDHDIDEPALIERCRASLARYKVPVRVVAVDAFPVSTGPNGPKISRAELRRLAAEMQSQGEPVL